MVSKHVKAFRAAAKESSRVFGLSSNTEDKALSDTGEQILSDIRMLLASPISRVSAEEYLQTAIEYIAFQVATER